VSAHQHDSDDTCPACLQPWAEAGSVSRLRELAARFVEGKLRARPHYFGAMVDSETEGLTGALAAINRAGLLTDNSQPGEEIDGWAQRAWISGFATETVIDTLLAGCLDTDLLVLALPPGMAQGARVCISRDGQKESTWSGAFEPLLELYFNGSEKLTSELVELWCVDIIDPVWGRNDLLWPTVQAALTARPTRQYYMH
jgi:hypothetical protein